MPTEIDPPGIVASLAAARANREAPPEEWTRGWRAGREALAGELEAAYRRGLRARPVCRHVVRLDLIACVVSFIAGIVIAAGIAAGQ